jgi:hypothetical protein
VTKKLTRGVRLTRRGLILTDPKKRSDFYKNVCDKDIYVAIMQYFAANTNNYHNLTSTYLIANSVFISITMLILSSSTNIISLCLAITTSLVGLTLCLQMRIAQGRFTFQNAYWQRLMRIIESHPDWMLFKYHGELYNLMENNTSIPPVNGFEEFKPNWEVKHHKKWWATRMKSLPWLFGTTFLILMCTAIILIIWHSP